MGIHVIQSQQIQVLVQGVLLRLQQPAKNPFAVLQKTHFVVPNPAIETWLTQTIAEQQGISANSQFHQRIRGFQWYCYQQVLSDKDHVRKANIPRLVMKWRIYQCLKHFIVEPSNILNPEHALFAVVQRIYDSAAGLRQPLEQQLKKQSMLYWVAEQVSKLFSNYMLYRGECQAACQGVCQCRNNWLAQWGQNQALDVEAYFAQKSQQQDAGQDQGFKFQQAQELEAWQRWLWQHTFHQDFSQMQGIDREFWQLLDDPERSTAALKKLPAQVIVFTVLDLPPAQLQFLRRLGQYLDVLILHYNPSQEYWADSVDPNWKKRYDLSVKERFIGKHPQATDAEIQRFFDAFTLNFNAEVRESRHPLLTRFGKQARDHFSLLSNLAAGDEGQWVDAFVDEPARHLLSKLQSDILYLVEPEAQGYVLAPNDDSIQIHVCHSSLRQLEVLKEQLIHWLAQGTQQDPRRPSDILVLVPDLKQTEALIRGVFPQSSHQDGVYLPIKIAGVTQTDVKHAWQAVLGRINLICSRFTLEQLSDWLGLTATQLRYGLDLNATERMLELLEKAGFKRGFDDTHLQQSLAAEDTDYRFSFKFALDRLAMGLAIPEHVLFQDTLCYAEVLPSDFALIGTLLEIYQDFDARRDWMLMHEQGQHRAVEKWLLILKQEIAEFEQMGVEALSHVAKVIQKQYTMLTLSYNYEQQDDQTASEQSSETMHPLSQDLHHIQLPLPYLIAEIEQSLETQLEQTVPTGSITFSQMGHIRPVPYKLMVVLNLDSGKFPNRNTQVPFDLMALLKPILGDRSRLEDDQGAFLDAMLLAQDNLWLFYNGFDVSDGEVRDPSSVLQELINHLALITRTATAPEDANAGIRVEWIDKNGIEIAAQLQSLYHVHALQPFDPVGFEQTAAIRYQDQWFQVAQQMRHVTGLRQPWVNAAYTVVPETFSVFDAGQWIQDVTFPARLYLKTLGVENLSARDFSEQDEPLLLDGLGRYAIRAYLQQHSDVHAIPAALLQDHLPVGKVQHTSLQMSLNEHDKLLKRLKCFAPEVTATTQRQWQIDKNHVMNIRLPTQLSTLWLSLDASSGRAQRRVKVWLEYLLWLNYLKSCHPNLNDETAMQYQRVAVFSDVTIMSTGLSASQAQQFLQAWFSAYQYAQTQPLVLPAALLYLPAEKGKDLQWDQDEQGQYRLKNFQDLQKEWDKAQGYLSFSLADMQWSKRHRDWQFILQEQDATALLQHACDQYSHDLYAPIYQYQTVVQE